MRRNSKSLFLIILAKCVLVSGLYAQTNARISGLIIDRSSNAVRAARIIAINMASGFESATTTDSDGRYQFNGLVPGTYRVVVESEGFSSAARVVTLEPGAAKVEADFTLEVGDIDEKIVITATRSERDSLEIPVRAETITQTQLLRQNITTTEDSLTNVLN